MTQDGNISLDLLRRRLAEAEKSGREAKENAEKTGGGGGSGTHMPPVSDNERIAKLEGAFEGVRQLQTTTFVVLAILTTVVIGLVGYNLKRTDDLNEKINLIPTQISKDLRDLTGALANAITASKQQAPQVILLPAPPPPAPPQEAPR